MYLCLTLAIGLTLIISGVCSYSRHHDSLHPMVFLCPLLGYSYVWQPYIYYHRGFLTPFFPIPDDQSYIQFVNFLGVLALCLGCLKGSEFKGRLMAGTGRRLSLRGLRRARMISYLFAAYGLTCWLIIMHNAGGIVRAYSRAKGGGWAASGYIGEGPNLCYAAIILYFISMQGKRFPLKSYGIIFLFALPHLMQGFLGTRRGPMFLIMGVLFLCYMTYRQARPKLIMVMLGLGTICLILMFVFSHRRVIYIGSQSRLSTDSMFEKLMPSEASNGDDFLVASGQILNARYHGNYLWGRRLFVLFVIRPIPKQIWPNKYKVFGMANANWINDAEWKESLGWRPVQGSAVGCVADLYREFSVYCVVPLFLIGFSYAKLWLRARTRQGVWTLLFIIGMGLSIYLPTQSMGAWLYRFLLMGLPSFLVWRYLLDPAQGGLVWSGDQGPIRKLYILPIEASRGIAHED